MGKILSKSAIFFSFLGIVLISQPKSASKVGSYEVLMNICFIHEEIVSKKEAITARVLDETWFE